MIKFPKINTICSCGCGENIISYWRQTYYSKYKLGHRARTQYLDGKHSPNWRGGRFIDGYGYIFILKPDHPRADLRGYVKEHILIMEEYLSRIAGGQIYITLPWIVHHINENKSDNRFINLQLMTSSEHKSLHMKRRNLLKQISRTALTSIIYSM